MSRREAIKNLYLEHRQFKARSLFAAVFILILVVLMLSRMVYLQIISHEHFITLSEENSVRLVALPPPRGLIYDRNGVLIAENLPSYRLEITPTEVEDIDATLERLRDIVPFDESDEQRFRKELRRKPSFLATALRFNLSDEEVARFAINRHFFPGIDIAARSSRHYPLGGSLVHALGYVGRIDDEDLRRLEEGGGQVDIKNYSGTTHIGKLGVEKFYEDVLHGTVGYEKVEINAQGRRLRVVDTQPPQPGRNIVLSIDVKLQAVAEQALGDFNGAVVAMDPSNGEVLALVSKPTYDPNLFVNGISSTAYKALRNDENRPLFNRALSGQYPPGSTIKPMMGLAGLEYGETWAGKTMMAGPYFMLPGQPRKYRDWKRQGHGRVNLSKAIIQSCDVYFYDLANKLGIDHIHEFLSHFGLGEISGLDTTSEASGLLPSREWKRRARGQVWFPGETVITGIGQGYLLTTPLQLSAATSMLAMRGERLRPRLSRATVDPLSGEQTWTPGYYAETLQLRREEYWDQVLKPMIDVVHKPNGTAHRISEDVKYQIAGKTGTAQVFGLKEDEEYDAEKIARKLRDHALFIGYAPADDPRIAIAVIVENAGGGGSNAAPVARKVMDAYLLDESEV